MQATVLPTRPSRPQRISRPGAAVQTRVHDWAQASGRMLVSTFFIAAAVSNMGEASFDFDVFGRADNSLLFNAMIYSMAFAVLVGRFMHIAALLLALVLLWTSTAAVTSGTQEISGYWQDLALVGALLFMAVSNGKAAAARAASAGAVLPRRVAPEGREGIEGNTRQTSRMSVARPVAMPMFVSRRQR